LEDLEIGKLESLIVRDFLTKLKKEFDSKGNKTIKVVELKKVEQGSRTMKEFVQEFRRVVRESGYKERPLIEEFKRELNSFIRQKLMELEQPPRNIK